MQSLQEQGVNIRSAILQMKQEHLDQLKARPLIQTAKWELHCFNINLYY